MIRSAEHITISDEWLQKLLLVSGFSSAAILLNACATPPAPIGDPETDINTESGHLVLKDSISGQTLIVGPKLDGIVPLGPNMRFRDYFNAYGGKAQDTLTKATYPWLTYETLVFDGPADLPAHRSETLMIVGTNGEIISTSFEKGEGQELPMSSYLVRIGSIDNRFLVQYRTFDDDGNRTTINLTINPTTGERSQIPVIGEAIGRIGQSTVVFDTSTDYGLSTISSYDLKTGAIHQLATEVDTAGVSNKGEIVIVSENGLIQSKDLTRSESKWNDLGKIDPNFRTRTRVGFTPDGKKILIGLWPHINFHGFLLVIDENKQHHLIYAGPGDAVRFSDQLDNNQFDSKVSNDRVVISDYKVVSGKYQPITSRTLYLEAEKKTGLYFQEAIIGKLDWSLLSQNTFIVTQSDGTQLEINYSGSKYILFEGEFESRIQDLISAAQKGTPIIAIVEPFDPIHSPTSKYADKEINVRIGELNTQKPFVIVGVNNSLLINEVTLNLLYLTIRRQTGTTK